MLTLNVYRLSKLFFASSVALFSVPQAFSRCYAFRRLSIPPKDRENIQIIVNGPSLDLSLISKSALTLCVNQFCLTEHYEKIRPELYLLVDFRYALPTDSKSSYSRGVDGLVDKTQWPMTLLIPSHFKNSLSQRLKKNKNISIVYYPISKFPATDLPRLLRPFFYYIGWMTPPASNVLVHAIYVSLMFSFRKINIHGANMDFFHNVKLDLKGVPVAIRKHFYGEEEVRLGISMAQFFQELSQSFSSFDDLSVVAKYKGTNIINHSPKTMIDSFMISELGSTSTFCDKKNDL